MKKRNLIAKDLYSKKFSQKKVKPKKGKILKLSHVQMQKVLKGLIK